MTLRFGSRLEPERLFADRCQEGVQRGSGGALSGDDDEPSADDGLRNVTDGQGRVGCGKCEGGHQGDGTGHAHELEQDRGVVGPVPQIGFVPPNGSAGAHCYGVVAGARGRGRPDVVAQRSDSTSPPCRARACAAGSANLNGSS